MKKLLLAAALLILPAIQAQAAPTLPGPTTGTIYMCVSILAFPGFPNVRVVQNANSCIPKIEYLQTISQTPPPSSLAIGVTCTTNNVSQGNGGFNIDAICPAGDIVLSGGWSCVDGESNVNNATVSVNSFFYSDFTPVGWQTIGNTGTFSGSCTVCATCAAGACKNAGSSNCLP